MKGTATLATTWPPTMAVVIRPRPAAPAEHPITRSAVDLELAIANVLETAKAHAVSVGRVPEQDAVANALRLEHGPLAALIADPIQMALGTAADILIRHARGSMPPDEFTKMAERLRVHVGKSSRYAADLRPRH